MTKFDYDLFVIGGGSGGVRAARMAAQAGARVALAEEWRMGGTCVIRGCIPKKLFVYASQFRENILDSKGYGWDFGDCTFDWPTLIANKDREIARLEGLYTTNVEKAGVKIFHDRAVFEDDHTLHLLNSGQKLTAATILIATGNRPTREMGTSRVIAGGELCITSDEAFHLKQLPGRILIDGGGYIALEFAHIFHGLGSQVSLLYRGALSRLVHSYQVAIGDASTEGDCVRLARAALPAPRGDFVTALVDAWQLAVYGGRPLATEHVLRLCADFDLLLPAVVNVAPGAQAGRR